MDEQRFRGYVRGFYTERYRTFADCPLYRGCVETSFLRNDRLDVLTERLWLPTYSADDDAVLDCLDQALVFERMLKAASPEREELLCGLYATGLIAIEALTRPRVSDQQMLGDVAWDRTQSIWPGGCAEYVQAVWTTIPAFLSASERMNGWHPEIARTMLRERVQEAADGTCLAENGREIVSAWAMAIAIDDERIDRAWALAKAEQARAGWDSVREQIAGIIDLWPESGRRDRWFLAMAR